MTELSRRDFLKYMSLGTAGAAGAIALAGCSKGGDTTTTTGGDTGTTSTAGSTTGTTIDTAETVTSNDMTVSGTKGGNVTLGPDSDKKTMVTVAAKTFETLDPFYLSGAMAKRMQAMLWTMWFELEYGSAEDIPVAVKEWSIDEDGQTLIFELHDNIVDQNGNNYTTDDLQWYIEHYTSVVGKTLSSVLDYEITGKYTGKIKMQLPYYGGYLAAANGTPFICITRASYEAAGDEGFRTNPITTGRYNAIDFVSGAYAVFEQNYNFWGDVDALPAYMAANVDVCRYDVITEESQIATALRTNTIQLYDIQVSTAEDFYADPGDVNVFKYPSLYPSFLEFNMYPGSIFADNKPLREAIAYGINWEDVAYAATMGYGSATGVIGHSSLAGYNPEWETDGTAWKYDKELAKQKLEESGYKPGELTIKFTYNQTPNDFAVMQANLAEIGINLEMDLLDEVTYMTKRGQANTLEWDIMGMDTVPKGLVSNIFYTMCDNTSYDWGQVNGTNDEELYKLAVAARYGTQEDIDKCYHAITERCIFIPRFNGNSFIGAYNKIEQVIVNSSQELIAQAALFADDYDIYY